MREFSEERAIGQVVARLTARYPSLDPDRIGTAVRQAHESFASSAVRDFVPLLVERHVREELDEGLRAAAV
ncbi:three-helix bundle dimerization domain-containing protein [Mycobacterium sp. PDNC021]|uniref:three-helix bundle dimerization domain-containing protein n=1 Tax=Mycobacterium sp. PDNC021 TaxID=3391399 RepID=UPI003AB0E351